MQHFDRQRELLRRAGRVTARKQWELARDLPWYGGHFRWTGFDYIGEAEAFSVARNATVETWTYIKKLD